MKQKITSLLAMLLAVSLLHAAPVTQDEARQRASAFLAKQRPQYAHRHLRPVQNTLALKPVSTQAYYYVFNVADDGGFVVVSGDDRTLPILGYADDGAFDEQQLPQNVKAWLQGYADELQWLDTHPDMLQTDELQTTQRSQAPLKTVVKNAVAPLLVSTWNQSAPYNNSCPAPNGSTHMVTGCVATAMAQVMYYHKWPDVTKKEIPAYEYQYSGNTLTYDAIGSGTPFDWSNMLPSYQDGDSDVQKAAVATLMSACGASVKMKYGYGASSAYSDDVADAMKNYFGYSATTTNIKRDNYLLTEWEDLLYSELLASRPVFYSGQSSGGGHAFVLDGYDGDGRFHVNWGWGGFCDGYFVVSVLNPMSTQGIGSSTSEDGYSYIQSAVIGAKKDEGEVAPDVAPMKGAITSVADKTITFTAFNALSEQATLDIALAYIKEDGSFDPIPLLTGNSLAPNSGYGLKYTITNLSDGTYRLVPVCKLSTSSTWQAYLNPQIHYVEAVIEGGNVSLTLHPQVDLTAKLNLAGDVKTNTSMTIEANVQNKGDEYYGCLYLFASTTDTKGDAIAMTGCTLPANRTSAVDFYVNFSTAGTYHLWVATDEVGDNVIGDATLEVSQNGTGTTSNNIDLDFALSISPLSDGAILGSSATVTITVTNKTDYDYSGNLYVYFYDYNQGELWTYTLSNVFVPAGSTIVRTQTFDDLKTGGLYYAFDVGYDKAGSIKQKDFYKTEYEVKTPMTYYTADGTKEVSVPTATFTVPTHATAVDLRGNTVTTSVSGGNPNTLYFLDADATAPDGVTSNIIRDGVAETLTITDGYSFFTPLDFTAHNVTYDRTFTSGYTEGGSGWTTITLPFDVEQVEVTVGDKNYPIDWFHSSSDVNKNFWVMEFALEDASSVRFGHADAIRSGRPYIIAVPGASWGENANLTDLPLHFKATNAQFKADFVAASTGNVFKMRGTVSETHVGGVYTLNEEGSKFTLNSGTVSPFRAYFVSTGTSVCYQTAFQVGIDNQPTSIRAITTSDAHSAESSDLWYDLSGRVTRHPVRHGLYIHNGQKVLIP